jgi:CelD/BcsL family acetyltransferase involved in cellulose biosynthesis
MTVGQLDLSIEVVDSFAGLEKFADQLARLFATNPAHTPFQSMEWCSLYWECLAPADWHLRVFLVTDHTSVLRGAAIMYIKPGSPLRPTTLGNLSSIMGDYGDILVEPGYEEAIWQKLIPKLVTQQSQWSALQIDNLPQTTPLMAIIEQQKPNSDRCQLSQEAVIHRADLPENFDEFLAGLDSKFRSNIKRRKKRLMKDHNIVFKSVENKEELDRIVDQFIEHQKARFAEQYKFGFFKNDDREYFFRRASAVFLEKGWLDLHYLLIDGRLGAAQFALQLSGVRHNFQIVMDPAHRVHSPGTLLMMSSIEASIENGIKVYDLGSGDYDYKQTLKAEPFGLYSCKWTRRPISSWANRQLSEIREGLESRLWVRRWAFKLHNMKSQQRPHRH